MDNTYKPTPASLFSTIARQTQPTGTYWGWCATCGEHADQVWVRDTRLGEVYRCSACNGEHEVKTR